MFVLFMCVILFMLFIRENLFIVFTKERLFMLFKFTCTVYRILRCAIPVVCLNYMVR